MLVYSRNTLISLRNWYKTFKKLSAPLHESVVRPVSTEVWEKLASHNLLASTRGQRGGDHVRNRRSIATVNLITSSDGASNSTQKGSTRSNLLNIHIDTSGAMTATTTTTTEHQCKTSNLPKSKLKIADLNVRSLKTRSHLLQVRELMQEKDYDVLAVSESWLNSTVTNAEVEIDGYKLTRLDRQGKSGGGVCAYTRSSLKVKRLKDMSEISESGFHQLWMQIQLKKLRSMLLCVAYRPDYCPLPCFVNNFMDKYTQALTFGKDILLVVT